MTRDELRTQLLQGYDQLLRNTFAARYFRNNPFFKKVVEAQRSIYATQDSAVDELLNAIQSQP